MSRYYFKQTSNTKEPTTRTQLRRPVPKGLAQGERLSKLPITSTSAFSEWGWVGTEVHSAEDIGPQHRAAACGFRKHICKNRHAPRKTPTPPSEPTPDDDVVVISSDDEPECSTKACKNNPNCCNYLGQQNWENEGSARKQHLEAAGLGPDPAASSRTDDIPVGLKNLGATCYANAFIQVWFQDLAFRAGVYNCVPELSLVPGKSVEESPVYQLQITFGALQHSGEKSFNPVKFVECLGIRTAEQQDAQEFSKLFMSHLDNEFKKQDNASLQSLMTDQFEGRQVYGTRCGTCQNASEHQSSFLELEISLTSDCKLEDRLKASLEDEKLEGDNQYDCSTCGSKQDAFRYLKLTHLPPVLHFSVLRFVFDAQQLSRKKSKQAISFPLSINMQPFVGGGGTELWYDLHGVLLHRGLSAYHGHYEAQVFDVTRNRWFLFNDEEVREMQIEELVGKQATGGSRLQVSKDAYMLIYAQRDAPTVDATTLRVPKHAFDTVQRLNAEHKASCDAYIQRKGELESDFALARKRKREIYQSWEVTSADEVSMVLDKAALESWMLRELDKNKSIRPTRPPADVNSHSVENPPSTSQRSEGSASPPPPGAIMRELNPSREKDAIQHTSQHAPQTGGRILCIHGLLDPTESANMKRISKQAWARIQELGTDAVAIESNLICEDCMAAVFNEKLYAMQHADMIQRFESCMNRDKGRGWWISKPWLKDWKLKKPKMHAPGHRDPVPDLPPFRSDVYCEHDGLTHSQKSREKITTAALDVLKEAFPEFDPPDTDTETCTVCEAVAASDREATREARAKAEAERSRLSMLARREFFGSIGVVRFVEGLTHVLIPLSFVHRWRAWLAKPLQIPRPGPIANDAFVCQHDMLLIDPAEEADIDGVICAISPSEWEILSELYGGGPYIECALAQADTDSDKSQVESNLAVCQDCRKARLSDYEQVDINVYRLADGEAIPGLNGNSTNPTPPQESTKAIDAPDVIHIDDTDVESPTLSDSASPPARAPGSRKRPPKYTPVKTYGQRKSKRLRTAATVKKGTTFSIRVSKNDTLRDVKRKIQDAEDILSFYQQLYLHGVELTDDSQTLLQIGFLRTDRLVLRAIEAMDEDEAVNWALTSGDAEPKVARPRPEGRAFGGTLLDGNLYAPSNNAAPPKAQEVNDHDMTPASPTPPDTDSNAEGPSEPPREIEMDSLEASFAMLEDGTVPAEVGKACARCTYINLPGLADCEMCEASLSS